MTTMMVCNNSRRQGRRRNDCLCRSLVVVEKSGVGTRLFPSSCRTAMGTLTVVLCCYWICMSTTTTITTTTTTTTARIPVFATAFSSPPPSLLTLSWGSNKRLTRRRSRRRFLHVASTNGESTPEGYTTTTTTSKQPQDDDESSFTSFNADSSSSKNNNSLSILQNADPEVAHWITMEENRQRRGLELIASENFCSLAVRQALGSCLTNKYSEGRVGARYYGGNQYIDALEQLCMDRALQLYQLSPSEWGVNVQPYSGSPANFAVYTALLQPHDRLMGLDLPSGGHLTHGYTAPSSGKKVSATSIYFESIPYVVVSAAPHKNNNGYIDYDDLSYRVQIVRPKLLIAGASAYPREWEYDRLRQIADSVNALLMVDMAHISGLVAARVAQSPFEHADVVTTTTHKSLRGPRAGMIFAKVPYMEAINQAVFPALQGGPHNHQIAALAVALREAQTPEFQVYAQTIVDNAQTLALALQTKYHQVLATGGTDNHLLLWDVRPLGLTGSKLEHVLEQADITTNKNALPGDTSALHPGGIRLGTPALTTRGMQRQDMEQVAELLYRGCQIAVQTQERQWQLQQQEQPLEHGGSSSDDTPAKANNKNNNNNNKVLLKDFKALLQNDASLQNQLQQLKMDVQNLASKFPMPGDD